MNTRGGVEVQLHGFVTLPLDGVLNAPAALSSEGEEKTERPRTGNHASKTTKAGATKFVRWRLKAVGPQYGTCFISPPRILRQLLDMLKIRVPRYNSVGAAGVFGGSDTVVTVVISTRKWVRKIHICRCQLHCSPRYPLIDSFFIFRCKVVVKNCPI